MSSRGFALPAVLALLLFGGCGGDPSDKRPDLFLIVLDTCRKDALGVYGGREDATPALDGLARDATLFERTIAPSPWTLTSVASILSGRHPTVHGASGRLQDVSAIRSDVPLAAEVLSDAGYRTLAVANAPFVAPRLGFARGFETYDFFPSRNVEVRRADVSVARLLDAIDAGRGDDRPVFAMLHLFDPHLAYDPPVATLGRYTDGYAGPLRAPFGELKRIRLGQWFPEEGDWPFIRGLYDEEVAASDLAIGAFLDGLRERGILEDALIVFTSDHGEEFGEHGGFEHGHTMHAELIEVPLIIKWPRGEDLVGRRVSSQVRLIDVAPTLVEAAGVDWPTPLPGKSLRQPAVARAPRDRPAYSEKVHLGPESRSLRDGHMTYIFTPGEDRRQLFASREDPGEQNDLCGDRPALCEAMHEALEAYRVGLESAAKDLESRTPAQLDEDTEERLRSLGYLGG